MTDTPAPLPTPTPAPAGNTDAPERPSTYVAPHLNFWQQPWVQTFLPLGTSLAIHLGIIILALLLAKTVDVVYKNVVQEQVIIPDATIIEGAEAGGIPNPGLGGDPT